MHPKFPRRCLLTTYDFHLRGGAVLNGNTSRKNIIQHARNPIKKTPENFGDKRFVTLATLLCGKEPRL